MQTPNKPTGRYLSRALKKRFSLSEINHASDLIVKHIDSKMSALGDGKTTVFISDFVAKDIDLDKELTRSLVGEINGGSNGATLGNPYEWR